MKHLLIILSALCLISCNKRGNDLYGVWYAIDTLHPESNYVERHITDSAISIVNNVNFSYFTKYDYDNNILEEYPLDPYDLSKILDTLTFQVEIKEGSMILTNMINSKVKSSWKKVENVEPFDIINDDSFKDTVLVVLSDHMALKNTASSRLEEGDRKNLFLIFSENLPNQEISKPGSMFDVAPTVMSLIGANTNSLGLGRNLFIKDSLMTGVKEMNKIIEEVRPTVASLWSFPDISNGFKISLEEEKILFGPRSVRFPALLLIDNKNKTQEIIFDFYYAKSLDKRVMDIKNQQKFIWIDSCIKIKPFIEIDPFAVKMDALVLASAAMPLAPRYSISAPFIDKE